MPQVKPWVTYALLGVTLLVFSLQLLSKALFGGLDFPAALLLKDNAAILHGEVWRLITPTFLHATGSILHIGFNMYALYILGPGLERHFGHGRFLALYLLSGFAGNVISFVFSPQYSLGSSTAIFGLIGAQAVFLYRHRVLFGQGARRALVNIITVAVINLIIGLSPGIDNWGHVGGLIGGTLFSWLGGPVLQVEGVFPSLRLSDHRQSASVFIAAVVVGLLFAALAGLKFYLGGMLP
jgi:rhomboid protease GluP